MPDTYRIVTANQLDKNQLAAIKALFVTVRTYDHCQPKFYWASIEHRAGHRTQDFLLYVGSQLVAYLAWFDFAPSSVEITCIVHPEYRGKNYFRILFSEAKTCIDKPDFTHFTVAVHERQLRAQQILSQLAGERGEQEWQLDLVLSTFNGIMNTAHDTDKQLSIRQASLDDIPTIASMDELCFNQNYLDSCAHYQNTLPEAERLVLLLYYNDEVIGKLHAKADDIYTVIHDFCIRPSYQGKGLGRYLMVKGIEQLFDTGADCIHVDVDDDNTRAISLYQSLGFHNTDTFCFWTLPRHV